jgi:hypothetical protein
MKTILIAAILSFITSTGDLLTGRWESKPSVNGNVTGVLFKADHTYEGYINKKPFVSGSYSLQDSVILIMENGCDGKTGVYKIIFFSNGDSLRFQSINDSCDERREGMNRTVLGRVK